jgi:hypothetical protein
VSRKVILFAVAVTAIAVMPAFAAKTILYYDSECCRNITEGEFAILYCQALNLREPGQGWTVQSAAAALSSLGHQPEGGWVLSRFLTESTMSRLLRNSKLSRKQFNQQDFQRSTRFVTIANAREAVPADDAITQGEFAVLLSRALNIPAPAHPSPDAAIRLLLSQPLQIKPLAGWQADAPLHESEMLEILATTPIRASSVDASAEISALQAFSLLFGKFEIATQGHFGLYIVEALNIPPPEGGWTTKKALDYVQKEFGVSGHYGVNRNAPLCADFFLDSLRSILLKIWQPANTPSQGRGASALLRMLGHAVPSSGGIPAADFAFSPSGSFEFVPQSKSNFSGPSAKDVDKFINEVRDSGLLPPNQCQPVAARGFSKAKQGPIGPIQPAGAPMPTPTPQPPPAGSTILPSPKKPPEE